MGYRAVLITGARIFKEEYKRNFHPAHFGDSNRAYWCNCMPSIFAKGKPLLIRSKRTKSARKVKFFSTKFTLWKRTHPIK